jgi:hypothetical protein
MGHAAEKAPGLVQDFRAGRGRRVRWVEMGQKAGRTGCADGLVREESSKEKRWAARWFGPKMKKEEMDYGIFFSSLIKGS